MTYTSQDRNLRGPHEHEHRDGLAWLRATDDSAPAFRRLRITWRLVLATSASVLWKGVLVVAIVALAVAGIRLDLHAPSLASREPSGSGLVVRSEVAVIWLPQILRELARGQAGRKLNTSHAELKAQLERGGWRDAWYAVSYRSWLQSGEISRVTHLRRMSESINHAEELGLALAAAAGSPPLVDRVDYSHASIELIPDAMRTVDPREALAHLMVIPAGDDESPPVAATVAP